MSKPQAPRRVGDDAALARSTVLRTSARKLNLVAASIRGLKVADALTALNFTTRRIAVDVKKALEAAIANAENNHQLDVDKLFVAEAYCGRTFSMRRSHARGRGKSAPIEKPFSNITVVVREMSKDAQPKGRKAKNVVKAQKSDQSTKASA